MSCLIWIYTVCPFVFEFSIQYNLHASYLRAFFFFDFADNELAQVAQC